jgi:ABC-2 type transport system ATP-binding protein
MTALAVEVRGLVKKYAGIPAVDGIDLHVERGECVAVLGPNGAGKTTAIEILEGYRSRDAGEVQVLGHDPGHPTSSWRSRIGIVLQTATDNAELSVHEVVSHFAHYYPRPRDPEAVIDAVGLSDKRKTRTRNLSGGQRRRLDVALGIIGRPELLFLDEPTTGFDPEARRDFWDLIDRLRADGTTILLTTHYLEEAERLADRVAVIARGRIVAEGTPSSLGGRESADAVVSWSTPEGTETRRTAEPTRLVSELAAHYGGEIPELTVRRPSLEDIYLSLVGRSAGSAYDTETVGDP